MVTPAVLASASVAVATGRPRHPLHAPSVDRIGAASIRIVGTLHDGLNTARARLERPRQPSRPTRACAVSRVTPSGVTCQNPPQGCNQPVRTTSMATRNDFSADQWQALRNAPQIVALATAAAGNSGLFGSISEGMAMASTMAAAMRGEQPLIREIFGKDEIRAAQDQIKGMVKSATDKASLNALLQKAATEDHVRCARRTGREGRHGRCGCIPRLARRNRPEGRECVHRRRIPGLRRGTRERR